MLKRKEITKLNFIIKRLLKILYKQYGYVGSLEVIDSLKKINDNEKKVFKQYIYELNLEAERPDGVDHQ